MMRGQSRSTLRPLATVFAAFVGLAAGYPSTVGSTTTAFILPLSHDFGWGRTIPSLMYLASTSGIALASLVLGWAIERAGAALVAMISGACLSLCLVLLSQQSGAILNALLFSFLAGLLGAGTGVGLYASVLPRWFDRGLGRGLGIAVLGQSVGLTIMPVLAATIISTEGWRSAYLALAGCQLILTGIAAAVLAWVGHPGRLAETSAPAAMTPSGFTLGEATTRAEFWLLGTMMFLATAAVLGVAVNIFPLYADRGLERSLLSVVAIAMGAGTVVGRLGTGVLLDYADARRVTAGLFVVGALGVVAIAFVGHTASLAAILVPPAMIGIALGAESDILAYMVRRLFGLAHYSVIYNRLLIAYYIGAVAGTVAMGVAFDHLADPRLAMMGLATCAILAGVISSLLPRMQHHGAGRAALSGSQTTGMS